MVYCCAQFCKSRSNSKLYKSIEKLSFHEFPSDLERRALWIKNVARKDWCPSDTQRLCSKHFTDDQYKVGKKHSFLLPTALPTVFEGRKPSRPSESPPSKKPERCRRRAASSESEAATIYLLSEDSKETKPSNDPSETADTERCKALETSKINEDRTRAKISREVAENDKLETYSGTEETAKHNTSPELLETCVIEATAKCKNPELPQLQSNSRNVRRLIVVSKNTTATVKNDKRYRLPEISSETVEHEKSANKLWLSPTSNNCQTPKLPNVSGKEKVTESPWPNDVEQHLATERKLKANQRMLYRLKAKIGNQKNEIAALKARLQKFTAMPLLEKVQNIERAANEDKLHAKFLLCQIKGFGKKRILWEDKLVQCFKHWRAMSGKGYDFPRSCGLLRLPHPSSLGRYADSSQVDAAISSVIEDLGHGPEVTSEEIHDATFLFDECEVAVTTISSEDCLNVVDANQIDQFPYIL